jgi:hypothetical protein
MMRQKTLTGKNEKTIYRKKTAWCDGCRDSTVQEVIGEGSGNTETKCVVCGRKNFQIQGFNINLM